MKIEDILGERFFTKDSYHEKPRGFKQNEAYPNSASFTVGGWSYHSEEVDYDEDTRKTFHSITDPKGNTHTLDWSPYSVPSKEDVGLFIKLGLPSRQQAGTNGPITRNDLIKLARNRGLQV